MNPKTINLNCDISSGEIIMRDAEGKEPVIRRSDFLKFVLAVKDGESEYSIADVQKVHIFAKAMQRGVAPTKNAPALFYKIFDKAENGEYEIPSELTTGEAGYYMLSVVLVKDTNLMTAFAGVFELRENGSGIIDRENVTPEYSGMFAQMLQAAMEAANAAAESKASAETALENVQSLETTIEGYKTAAQDAAEAAADSEAFAAQNAQESEDFRDEAEGFAAAAQSSKAAAELAAGTAVNSSDLAALCRRAANVGLFQFDGGYLGVPGGAAKINSLPMSICLTYNVKEWSLAARLNLLLSDNNRAGLSLWLGDQSNPFLDFMAKNPSGSSRQRLRTTALPAGLHTLVVAVGGTISGGAVALEYFIDGIAQTVANPNVVKTLADTDMSASGGDVQIGTAQSNTAGAVSLSAENWNLSRVKIFNFDMTAEGAPYTVADYAAGIEPSPVLMLGTPATSDSAMGASTGEGWTQGAVSNTTGTSGDWRFGSGTTYVKNRELTQADYDGGLPEGITSAVDLKTVEFIGFNGVLSNFCNNAADFSQYAGKTVKAKISFWMRNNAVSSQKTITIGTGYSVFKQISAADQTNYPNGAWKRFSEIVECKFPENLAATNYRIGIAANSKGADDNDYCVSIADFKFEVIGANLALSDAADASQIRDKSGNGNHALISGEVLPSKSNNPAHCAQTITWAGTSTLQNVCGDAAISANSKVTAYAKATGAVTASFKAGANTAQSKELAANTLTEVGSWLCGAAGAFSVQPSAAYTGSIETYLKIERF